MVKEFIKKSFDFIAALVFLIIILPLLAVLALLIKIDSRGPVFFRQERLGRGGKAFRIWKLRTMVENAENSGQGLASSKNDPRITKIGKFLREWTLDEWPQLINIIKGEMSLVGPRPLPRYKDQGSFLDKLWEKRLAVSPGLICLVDIKGRGLVSWEKRLEYDAWYVDNWSLLLDLKILFLGFFAVLSRRGVYGEGGTNSLPPKGK